MSYGCAILHRFIEIVDFKMVMDAEIQFIHAKRRNLPKDEMPSPHFATAKTPEKSVTWCRSHVSPFADLSIRLGGYPPSSLTGRLFFQEI